MGTNALIGIMDRDENQVYYAYVGSDGYPEYTGELLKERYNTTRLVGELVALSDFKILRHTIEKTEREVYLKARFWQPLSYNRFLKQRGVNYLYLFIDGKWLVKSIRDDDFQPL